MAISKLGSLGANIVLGWVLLQRDFGVFAVAIGVASVVGVFRQAGIRQVLVQKGAKRYERLEGPAFWFGTVLCVASGGVLVAAAYPLQRAYSEPIAGLLIVLGIGLATSVFGAIYGSKLSVDLRYRELAEMQVVTSVARFGSMIVFALLGFGVMSFALPWVVASVGEAVYGYSATRRTPWRKAPRVRLWPALFSRVIKVIGANAGIALMRQGTYVVLGALETAVTLGVYFFAYQLINQVNILLSWSVQQVLLPALSRLKDEPERHVAAVLRSARAMTALGAMFALGLACVIGPLEEIIWRQKWLDSVLAVQVMAIFFPIRLLLGVFNSAMMSRGEYGLLARISLAQGCGIMLAAGGAGWFFDEAWLFAMVVGAYFSTVVLAAMLLGLRRIGVPPRELLGVTLPSWAIALFSANISLWFDVAFIAPRLLQTEMGPGVGVEWVLLGIAVVRAVILGGLFMLVYLVLLRVLRPADLEEMLRVSPARVRGLARRVVRLPATAPRMVSDG